MKADIPDKILINRGEDGKLHHSYWTTDQQLIPFEDTIYIRKDALVEWAKFVLKCQEEELAKYDGPSYMKASIMGRIDAYKVLIAKLNSL